MSDIGVLKQLLIVLTATFAIVFLFQKLRLPSIVGFLLAGVIMGPDALGLIPDLQQVELLAEIGVVLLLFTIGLEFSLAELLTARRSVLWAGTLQILLTTLAVLGVSFLLDYSLRVGIFYGFLVSLSSTAIVLKMYSDRREIDSLQGRLATGILLFQDLCIVPMMLLVPILGQTGNVSLTFVAWTLVKAVLVLVVVVLMARTALPWLLRQVAILRNREIFLLFVIFVCLGTAWLTSEFGLSLALGAFIAGLLISESEYSHQIVADILPLRDCFSGIFFISIGMLLNLHYLVQNVFAAALDLLLIVGIKSIVIFVVYWWLYRSLRIGILLALSLAQIGEFSFILAKAGQSFGIFSAAREQAFLATSILSMIATPVLIQWAHGFAFGLETMMGVPGKEPETEGGDAGSTTGHVIVVGYGLNGQNLARVLKQVGISYRILEMDPDLVQRGRDSGEPIHFGDGTRTEVLRHLGIERARVLVVAISDVVATVRIVWQAKNIKPDLYILVRIKPHARFERSEDDLIYEHHISFPQAALGGKIVVPTIGNEKSSIKIPNGTHDGMMLRIKERGMPRLRGRGQPRDVDRRLRR